jgi:DNA-binding MarR family transcriptional regulator
MSDTFTRDRFRWLDALAGDPEMTPGDFIVGYAIATTVKRNSGSKVWVSESNGPDDVVCEAWIGAKAIAKRIGMSHGTVFARAQKLEQQGYIQVDPGKPGSGHSHHYRLMEKGQPADHSDKTKGQPADHLSPEKVSPLTIKGQPADMNPLLPLKDTFEEERGAPPARPRGPLSGEGGSPPSTTMTESMRTRALERAGWKSSRAGIEYGKFRHRCLSKGTQSHDWEAEWALWVERGLEYDTQKAQHRGKVIDQDGNEVSSPPKRKPGTGRKSNLERGREMFRSAQ